MFFFFLIFWVEKKRKRVLQGQVHNEVLKSGSVGQVHEVLWDMLRAMQVRSFWDLWQQARMPLLPRQAQQEGQAQVPLI